MNYRIDQTGMRIAKADALKPYEFPEHGLRRAGNSIEWYRCQCGEQSNLLWTYKDNKSRILACSIDCAVAKVRGQIKLGFLPA